MKTKNRRIGLLAYIGIAIMVGSVLIFMLGHSSPVSPHTYLGFGFLLFAEFVCFGGTSLVEYLSGKRHQTFWRTSSATVLVFYGVAVFIISFLYMNLPVVGYRAFLIIQILLALMAGILLAIFHHMSVSLEENSRAMLEAEASGKDLVRRMELLSSHDQVGPQMAILAQELRYGDLTVWNDADRQLQAVLGKLEQTLSTEHVPQDQIDQMVHEMTALVQKRKQQSPGVKVGGI